jgi:hypothetical protein
LFLGEVLSPAANLWVEVPFRGEATQDLTPYFNGIQGDVWRACEPWHIFQFTAAQSGEFPLWNPHIFCGFPFHGDAQSATLSPFHWIYFVVHPRWAAGPISAVKLWVAAFATFCLARRLNMTPLAAFLSGAVWMLSAFNVRWLLWPLATATILLPVILVALDALVVSPSLRRLGLAGLAATVLQLSGHPECQFYVGFLSGLYVLLRVLWLQASLKERVWRVLLALAAHLLGLLGSAVSLLPFAEQVHDSMDWVASTHAPQYMPAEGLLGAIAPDHFGRPRAGRIYYDRLGVNYNEAGMYFGLAPLALTFAVLIRAAVRPRQTLHDPIGCAVAIFGSWLLLCGAIVLGLPGITPLVRAMPLFSKSDTMRLLFGIQFAGAMLAGAAWTWISQSPCRLIGRSLIVASIAIAVALAALVLMPAVPGLYSHLEGLRILWTDATTPSPLEHRSLRTLVSLIVALLMVMWAVLSIRSISRQGVGPSHRVGAMLTALVLADLVWVAYGFNPIVPPGIVFPESPKSLSRVKSNLSDGRLIATGEILAPNLAMVYGFRDLRGYDFPIDTRWARLFKELGWIGDKASITLLPRDHVFPCVRPRLQSVLDKCAVRFLYTNLKRDKLIVCGDAEGSESIANWPVVQLGPGDDAVYQNPTAYARAYLARRVTRADPETALTAVLDMRHDLRAHSFVEDPAELMQPLDQHAASNGTVTFEKDGSDEVILRTESDTPGLLVLSDRYDRGWRVAIDGREARALRANYLFRGVMVPAGDHTIRWTYEPASFNWGLSISAATALVFVALLILSTRPHRLTPAEAQIGIPCPLR